MQAIDQIKARIESAALKSGRKPEDITLVAVSKLHSIEEINPVVRAGLTQLAENKVQELLTKYGKIDGDVTWHLIGHLQTNKVKSIVDKVDLIQSVDSLRIANEINKRCAEIGKIMDILIQVNAAGEEQKSGISVDELFPLYEEITKLTNIRVRGLMQIAPAAEDPNDVRKYFRIVKECYDKIPGLDILSMGMSHDFEVAIEEGANMVRIGTAIFGERNY